MFHLTDLLLIIAALLGGAMNSVAGGGTFFAFPALVFAGITPVIANATCTVALFPGMMASVFAYLSELRIDRRTMLVLIAMSLLGGTLGAVLLLYTPDNTFAAMVPWLLLAATVLFTVSRKVTLWLRKGAVLEDVDLGHSSRIVVVAMVQFIISIYGGYFGAGMGILMLAMLGLAGMHHIHRMNALKTVMATAINAAAFAIFVFSGVIAWREGVMMMVAATAGGYLGAYYAKKLPPEPVRKFVIVVAWVLTAYFFIGEW